MVKRASPGKPHSTPPRNEWTRPFPDHGRRSFTTEQEQWLDLIRQHLIENLHEMD